GGLGRLAVVGIPLPAALPQLVGIDVVAGRPVGRPHLLQKSHRLRFALHVGSHRQKAALLFLILPGGRPPDGAVFFQNVLLPLLAMPWFCRALPCARLPSLPAGDGAAAPFRVLLIPAGGPGP